MSAQAPGRIARSVTCNGMFYVTPAYRDLPEPLRPIHPTTGDWCLQGRDNAATQAATDRLIALWNAAEELGLTTEAIEAGAIQAVVRAAEAAQEVLVACVVPAGGCDDADVLATTREELAVALAPIIGVRT